MASNTRQATDNAIETEKIASQSAEEAKQSGASVREALEAMNIIASKVTVIQEIARQTDLLALTRQSKRRVLASTARVSLSSPAKFGSWLNAVRSAASEISELSRRP